LAFTYTIFLKNLGAPLEDEDEEEDLPFIYTLKPSLP
jgi:hypothetical protein